MNNTLFRIIAIIIFAMVLIIGYIMTNNTTDSKPTTQQNSSDYSIH